jgi:hypothetical protein
MPKTTQTKPRAAISFDAVLQRLNRHLKAQDQHFVHGPRGRGDRVERSWFVIDLRSNTLVTGQLTPRHIEAMARERGLLKAWEEVQ